MKAVAKAGRLWKGPSATEGQGVLLTEWEKPGWTYHAKGMSTLPPATAADFNPTGIWLSPTPSAPPILTLFGSTNLNSRSAHIDTELSFLMILPSEPQVAAFDSSADRAPAPIDQPLHTLRRDLASEISGIRSNARKWKGDERNVRWTTKFIVWAVKGML